MKKSLDEKKDLAISLIKKYGLETFSSSLTDSDYITKPVKTPFGYKKEVIYFSDEYVNQVLRRHLLNTYLTKTMKQCKEQAKLCMTLKNEMENVYNKKMDDSIFDTICDELLTYMITNRIPKNKDDNRNYLKSDEITQLEIYKNAIQNFKTSTHTSIGRDRDL